LRAGEFDDADELVPGKTPWGQPWKYRSLVSEKARTPVKLFAFSRNGESRLISLI